MSADRLNPKRLTFAQLKEEGFDPTLYAEWVNAHCNALDVRAEVCKGFVLLHPLPY